MTTETQVLDTDEAKAQAAADAALQAQAAAEAGNKDDEALSRARKDRSKANREAQEAKTEAATLRKRNEELEAAETAREKKDMDAITLAETEKAEAEAKTAALQVKLDTTTRETAARDAGVNGKYASYAGQELAKAQATDKDLTDADFFATFKTDNPAFYNGKPAPLKTGEGGASDQTKPTDEATAIIEIEAKLKAEPGRPDALQLKRRLNSLKRKKE